MTDEHLMCSPAKTNLTEIIWSRLGLDTGCSLYKTPRRHNIDLSDFITKNDVIKSKCYCVFEQKEENGQGG